MHYSASIRIIRIALSRLANAFNNSIIRFVNEWILLSVVSDLQSIVSPGLDLEIRQPLGIPSVL